MQCILFLDLRNKTRKGYQLKIGFFSFQTVLSPAISNSAFPRLLVQGDASYSSKEEFYHISSLALFTAAVFICCLLVNLRPASQEAVIGKNLTYLDLFGSLFVFFPR